MARERGRPPVGTGKETAFGAWLKSRREALGWSSEQAAERFGLSQSMVSLYERGVRSPKRETAQRIGEELGDVEGSLQAAGYATPDSIDMVILRKIQSLNDTDKEQMERLIDRLVRDSLQ